MGARLPAASDTLLLVVAAGSAGAALARRSDRPLAPLGVTTQAGSSHRGATLSPERLALAATLAVGFLLAEDELRWQPWALHGVMIGALLAWTRPREAIGLARWVAVAVYGWSALAKLDSEFAHTLGQQLLSAAIDPLGASPAEWPPGVRVAAALSAPAAELGVAALLAVSVGAPRWRAAACAAALAQHAATILLVGPLGLGHSVGVLVWNAGFALQTLALFAPLDAVRHAPRPAAPSRVGPAIATAMAAAASIGPAAWHVGLADAWPSWALYAPGGERATVLVHRAVFDRLPPGLVAASSVAPDRPGGDAWRVARVDRWMLADTGAPLYPANRVALAIAASLAERLPLGDRVRVVAEGPAGRIGRGRSERVYDGAKQCSDASLLWGVRPTVVWARGP